MHNSEDKNAIKDLSTNAQANLALPHTTIKVLTAVAKDLYDKETNPNGIINAGLATNKLMSTEILEKLNSSANFEEADLDYGIPFGTQDMREAIADNVVNKHFKPGRPISADDIVVLNGCTSIIDAYIFSVCEPGDAVLIASPYYVAFDTDVGVRSRAIATPVHVPMGMFNDLEQVKYYEQKVKELAKKGVRSRCIIICNPSNPTGKCYSKEVIEGLLRFANSNDLHVLFDEIYALSVFRDRQSDDGTGETLHPFASILQWENVGEYIDPSRVSIAHGLSKDFCLNGFRLGWLISPWNMPLLHSLVVVSIFGSRPTMVDRKVTLLLQDSQFVDYLITTNRQRLQSNYSRVTQFLTSHSIPFVPAQAGHFIWIDLSRALAWHKSLVLAEEGEGKETNAEPTFEDEDKLWMYILHQSKFYLASGHAFHSHSPGWFRLTFTLPWETLSLGLDRLVDLLADLEGSHLSSTSQ